MKKLALLFFISLTFIITSCKKDRVESPGFESLDGYYNDRKEPEQSFTIDSDEGGPIIGKKGTELYPNRSDLQNANGDSVDLPYNVHLTELYSIYDFVVNKFPTNTGSIILTSKGMIKVRATKDNGTLSLRDGKFFTAKLSSTADIDGMTIYQGNFPNDEFTNWSSASDGSSASIVDSKYTLSLGSLDLWQNCGKQTTSGQGSITFTINATGTEHIALGVKPTATHGVVLGSNLVINNVPFGEPITVYAFARDTNGDYQLYNETMTITEDTVLELNMSTVSEGGIDSFLLSL